MYKVSVTRASEVPIILLVENKSSGLHFLCDLLETSRRVISYQVSTLGINGIEVKPSDFGWSIFTKWSVS